MSERTTSRIIPRLDPNDSVPLLTEVVELPETAFEAHAPAQATVIDTSDMPESDVVTSVGDTESPIGEATPAMVDPAPFMPGDDDLRAVRTELLTRVMMRFRTEWPQVVEAHTEATLQSRLAPLTAQLASELTQALEARLVEWLDATLEEIERDPGGI
ncbi:MAG: hypothetical protein JO278_00420 [Dyella sp.]|nr:hypothetical protein [Dyella sp.]